VRAGPVATVLALLLLAWVGPASARDPLFAAMDMLHDKVEPEAPEFALPTPEGRVVSLASFRGRVVLLNFWATWCPPCRVEMPAMEQLHRALEDQGLTILAMDQDESPKLVAKFMRDFRLSFPALIDSGSRVSSQYGVRGLPTTHLIDRRGRVVGGAVGPRDWASRQGHALIRSVLERR